VDKPAVSASKACSKAGTQKAMRKTIAIIQGHSITLNEDGSVEWDSKGAVDDDGSGGNAWGDPDFQPSTSFRQDGQSLNAETENYVVVPPAVLEGVAPIVLGCQAEVSYGGKTVQAVVGDIGPHAKLGENSVALYRALGLLDSPLSGGVDSGMHTKIWPGTPAIANGKTYTLQPS